MVHRRICNSGTVFYYWKMTADGAQGFHQWPLCICCCKRWQGCSLDAGAHQSLPHPLELGSHHWGRMGWDTGELRQTQGLGACSLWAKCGKGLGDIFSADILTFVSSSACPLDLLSKFAGSGPSRPPLHTLGHGVGYINTVFYVTLDTHIISYCPQDTAGPELALLCLAGSI